MHQEVVVDWTKEDELAYPPEAWELIDLIPAERDWWESATLQGLGLVLLCSVLAWAATFDGLHWVGQETAKKILVDWGAELLLIAIGAGRGIYGRLRLGGLRLCPSQESANQESPPVPVGSGGERQPNQSAPMRLR